jgi:hypothetical protein
VEGGQPAAGQMQTLWAQLLEAIGKVSPFARSYFIEAHPVSFARNVFTIGFDPEFAEHISMVDNAKNHSLIATKLAELGWPGAQIRIVEAARPEDFTPPVAGPPAATPPPVTVPVQAAPPAPTAANPAKQNPIDPNEFKNDPLIRKALEIFKGRIVEIRA